MKIKNYPELASILHKGGYPDLSRQHELEVNQDEVEKHLKHVRSSHPEMSEAHRLARAQYRAIAEDEHQKAVASRFIAPPELKARVPWWAVVAWAVAILVLLFALVLVTAIKAHAEPDPGANAVSTEQVVHALLLNPRIFPDINPGSPVLARTQFLVGGVWTSVSSGNPYPVTCVSGCSATGAFTDNSAFTVGTSAVSNIGAYFTSGADPAITTGNSGRVRMDAHSYLFTDCVVGCSGGSTTPSDTFANPTTAGLQFDLLAGYNGSTWDRLRSSIANGLQVDVTRVQGNVAVTGTFWQATQPISAASLPLPTGAAADSSVNGILNAQGSATSGEKGPLAQCAVTTGAPSYTTAQTDPLSCNTAGGLRVDPSGVTSPVSLASVPLPSGASISADQCGFSGSNCNVNDAQQGGTNITTTPVAMGSGTPAGNAPNVNAAMYQGTTPVTNDGTAGVPAVGGHKADNGAAAGTDRVPDLPCIYQTDYANGSAATQGRNGAAECGTDGMLWTAQLPAIRPASYHASASFAGSSTTFAFHIAGNASDTVLVTKIMFTCTQTTAGTVTVTVNKTSAASTGGTAATMTAVPDDSNYAAASSVAQSFTGTGPTAGTPVGQVDAAKIGCISTTTATPNDVYVLNLRQKPIVLRGTAQTLEVGVGGATTGGNYTGTVEWIETKTITP